MLKELPDENNSRWVFRLDRLPALDELLREMGLDPVGAEEIRSLLAESGYGLRPDQPDELLDRAFEQRPNASRFSDGSFPVLYGSWESETAEAELKYWLPRRIGQPDNPRPVHYQLFKYRFEGLEKDLRPKIADWPDLTHDFDYSFCNGLGAEAIQLGLDGLVTFSARHTAGVNQPVFPREAVGQPVLESDVVMIYDPKSGDVSVHYVNQ